MTFSLNMGLSCLHIIIAVVLVHEGKVAIQINNLGQLHVFGGTYNNYYVAAWLLFIFVSHGLAPATGTITDTKLL